MIVHNNMKYYVTRSRRHNRWTDKNDMHNTDERKNANLKRAELYIM